MNSGRLNKLINKLGSNDPSARRSAAEALSAGDERAIYPLLQALRDENPGVQDAAMRSLINIGGEVTAYMVIPLLKEEALIRNTAFIILREIGNIDLLSGLLKDKDDDVRKFAIDLMTDIGDPGACQYLGPMLNDTNPNVRAATVKAIGKLGCPGSIKELINALKDEEWVCFSALEAIAEIKDPAALEPLTELLYSPAGAIRYSVIEALGKIGTHKAGVVLKEFIKDASGLEKNAILKSLIEIGLTPEMKDLSEILMAMLQSDDKEDILIALKGLVSIGCYEAIPVIVDKGGSLDPSLPDEIETLTVFREALLRIGCSEKLMEVIGSPGTRFRGKVLAIEALGKMRCRKAASHLIKVIKSPLRDVRRAGAAALGELNADNETIEALLSATDDPDGHVRKAAVIALGRLSDPSAYDALLKLLMIEPYRDVREEIIRSLMRIDEKQFVSGLNDYDEATREMTASFSEDTDVIIALSGDASPIVRVSAVLSLGKTPQEERTLRRIKEATRDADPDVRKAAAQCIEEMGCCREELTDLLKDSDMWVRFYALRALASINGSQSLEPIVSMLYDPEVPVMLGAIEALSGIDHPDALKALEALREHENPDIREKIAEALETSW
jgi:HEAT repeat protein